jgi:hypothetical protein
VGYGRGDVGGGGGGCEGMGMGKDAFEIRPGQANALKWMNRVAPGFILKQLSKPMDRMLDGKGG